MFYDPMIAKLCTHAATREQATVAMSEALDRFVVEGIEHNVPFLSALMAHPRWLSGEISTGFIAEEYPEGFKGVTPDDVTVDTLVGAGLAIGLSERIRRDRFRNRLRPHSGALNPKWMVMLGLDANPVELVSLEQDDDMLIEAQLSPDGEVATIITDWVPGERVMSVQIDGKLFHIHVRREGTAYMLSHRGVTEKVQLLRPREAELIAKMPLKQAPDTSKMLLCPMPGLVVSIAVEEGQQVQAGEVLASVEAMKMENILRAEQDVTIAAIKAEIGDSLAVDAVIMEFE